jgi:arylsulfatase A-like enzyme
MKKPNIVFFFTDDQRFDTIAALGNKTIQTPNMDKLVDRGCSFTHAHIPCGTSGAVCMPSRAMLWTGRSLFHIEREGQSIPPEHTTMGETFQKAGYTTYGTGKWHNGTKSFARTFSTGGEIFFGGMQDHWNVPAHSFDPTGEYAARTRKVNNPMFDNKEIVNICDHVTPGKHSSELFADAAIEFLDGRTEENPFLLYISFMAPHDPRSMPDEYRALYDLEKIELPPNYRDSHPINYGIRDCRDEVLAAWPRKEEEVKLHIAEYYAMITHLDYQIGRVMNALEERGELDNTIIVFAGDNGLSVGQHGLMGKQNLYDHSIRVPLILAGPGIPEGEKTDRYAYLFDIFPTLCGLTGVDAPESVEGINWVEGLQRDEEPREYLYFAFTELLRGVKNRKYKLIEYMGNGTDETELFDLENDPWEMHNLAGKPEVQVVVEELRTHLFALRDEWDDRDHPLGKIFWDDYTQRRSLS